MNTKDLEKQADKVAWQVAGNPSVYMKLVRIINWVAVLVGRILSLLK